MVFSRQHFGSQVNKKTYLKSLGTPKYPVYVIETLTKITREALYNNASNYSVFSSLACILQHREFYFQILCGNEWAHIWYFIDKEHLN